MSPLLLSAKCFAKSSLSFRALETWRQTVAMLPHLHAAHHYCGFAAKRLAVANPMVRFRVSVVYHFLGGHTFPYTF
jgi:hypothetical protein